MHKVLLFILSGVAIVLSICFASYFVLMKFRPEGEVRRMLVAMSELQTFSHQTGLTWTLTQEEGRVNALLYLSGQVNLTQPERVESDTAFRFVRRSRTADYAQLSGQIRALN